MSETASAAGRVWSRAREQAIRADPLDARTLPLAAASVAEALSDASSRRVLAACVHAPRAVKDLSEELAMPLATAYRQVHRLMDLGVLVVERSAMTPEGKKYDLYRSRILEAHLDLAGGGESVRWIANDAIEHRIIGLWDAFRYEARGRP